MKRQDKRFLRIVGMILYTLIAFFLCMASITNPSLSEVEQWWCIAAILWGPIILLIIFWIAV